MKNIFKNLKEGSGLHHFYIIEGDRESVAEYLLSFLKEGLNYQTKANPLFFKRDFDRLLTDDAKEIGDRAILKTPAGNKMIFFLSLNTATSEAQNSLLKIVEEPPYETYFFFSVPRVDIFLPTLLSRSIVIKSINENRESILSKLLSMSIGERIAWGDKIAKKISDEKIPRGEAQKIIDSLIFDIKKELPEKPEYAKTLKTLQKISKYMNLTGASVKMLLNRAVLTL